MHFRRAGRCSGSTRFCVRCCGQAPTNWSTARTCPAAWWCPNMSTSRTPLSKRTRPAWSTPCSTRSRASSAPTSSRVASGKPASGEDSLIARYFRPIATDPGAFRLDDDAAALKPNGDEIVVTTDAIVEGVHFLADDPPDTVARKALVGRYRVPQPRVAMTEIVRDYASAAMDVSDGLAGDLTKLCGVSGVSAVIDMASVPLSDPARDLVSHGIVGLETLIAGGDDYEILCTLPEDRVEAFAQAAKRVGVTVSSIGTVVAGDAVPKFIDGQGREIVLERLSYSHF